MFPGQEAPSPSCAPYLFGPRARARSPIFIRLYLRLESVPLHFLSRSSLSLPKGRERRQLSPSRSVLPPRSRGVAGRCGDNNMQTFRYLQFECRKTCSRGGGERRESISICARPLFLSSRSFCRRPCARSLSLSRQKVREKKREAGKEERKEDEEEEASVRYTYSIRGEREPR